MLRACRKRHAARLTSFATLCAHRCGPERDHQLSNPGIQGWTSAGVVSGICKPLPLIPDQCDHREFRDELEDYSISRGTIRFPLDKRCQQAGQADCEGESGGATDSSLSRRQCPFHLSCFFAINHQMTLRRVAARKVFRDCSDALQWQRSLT